MSRANTTRKLSARPTIARPVAETRPDPPPQRASPAVSALSAVIASLLLWAGLIWTVDKILGMFIG